MTACHICGKKIWPWQSWSWKYLPVQQSPKLLESMDLHWQKLATTEKMELTMSVHNKCRKIWESIQK